MKLTFRLFLTLSVLLLILLSYKLIKNHLKKTDELNYYGISSEQLTEVKKRKKLADISSNSFNIRNLVVTDLRKEKFNLKDLVKNKSKLLIIKFSTTQCSYCIDHILEYVKKYEELIGIDNIIYLGEFTSEKDFFHFKKINNINSRVFDISQENSGLPIDNLKEPYLVIVNSSLTPIEIFIPLKSLPKRTEDFIQKNFFQIAENKYLGKKLIFSNNLKLYKPFTKYKKDSLSISNSKYKIYSYINASCGSCISEIESWNSTNSEFSQYNVPIIIICSSDDNFALFKHICDSKKIKKFPYPFFTEDNPSDLNEFLKKSKHFQTLLTDKDNIILALGNPMLSKKIKNNYLKLINN